MGVVTEYDGVYDATAAVAGDAGPHSPLVEIKELRQRLYEVSHQLQVERDRRQALSTELTITRSRLTRHTLAGLTDNSEIIKNLLTAKNELRKMNKAMMKKNRRIASLTYKLCVISSTV